MATHVVGHVFGHVVGLVRDSFQTLLTEFNRWHAIGLIAIFLIFKVIHQLFLWPYFLSPLRNANGPSMGHPILGQLPTMLRSEPGASYIRWAHEHGSAVRVVGPVGIERMGFMNPSALQKILVSDWMEYPRPEFLKKILGTTSGFGLLTVTGEEHRLMRKAMNPAFSIASLTAQTDMYYDPIYSLVNILKAEIEAERQPSEGKVFSMYDWLSKATLDIICLTAFGYKSDSLHNPKNELAEAYHALVDLQSGTNMWILISAISIPGCSSLIQTEWFYRHRHWIAKSSLLSPMITLIESMRRIKAVARTILQEKLADTAVVASDMASKRDVMSLLVQARQRESGQGYRMSDEAMMDQVLTFLGAGHETIASGLAWTLWLLVTHKDIQAKLRAEVAPLVANNPTPDFRSLKQMMYLEAVVMESLRVMPPVPMAVRKAGKSDFIDDIWVPKGTLVDIPIRAINTYAPIWGDDAEDFRPERWFDLPKTYHPSLSLLSFIAGPHHCIGRTMAMVEMKAVLAVLISHFEFDSAYLGQRAQPTAAITMKPADNLPLRVRVVKKL